MPDQFTRGRRADCNDRGMGARGETGDKKKDVSLVYSPPICACLNEFFGCNARIREWRYFCKESFRKFVQVIVNCMCIQGPHCGHIEDELYSAKRYPRWSVPGNNEARRIREAHA